MYKLLKNWKAVILSIGGATTFWFFNALNKDYSARVDYPIEFQFDRDSVVIMEPLPQTVSIDVSSGGWNLLRKTFLFNIQPIQIDLDNPTEINFYTRASLMPLVTEQLSGLKIDNVVTDTVFINIEEKKVKRVVLKVDSLAISLEKNHRVTSPITIKPDTIELIGPESFIDSLTRTYQFQLAARSIDDPFDAEVEVAVPNGNLIRALPAKVNVKFQVERFDQVKVAVPVEAVNFPKDSSIWISQETVDVVFHVSRSKKDTYSPDDFAVTADLSMADKADSTVIAMLIFYPEEIIDATVMPENIKLKYE